MMPRGRIVGFVLLATPVAPGWSIAQSTGSDTAKSVSADRIVQLWPAQLIRPLAADPHAPRFAVGLRYGSFPFGKTVVGTADFGGRFGVLRRPGGRLGDGIQLGVEGAVFTQFDMRTVDNDLVTEDYIVGMPISWRRGPNSLNFRLYHRSSHAGDEYLKHSGDERFNVTYESINLLGARDLGPARVYAGYDYAYKTYTTNIDPGIAQVGVDFAQRTPSVTFGRFARGSWWGGVDIQSSRDLAWRSTVSVKLGLDAADRRTVSGRRAGFYLEWLRGPSPAGQFHGHTLSYVGLSALLTL